jgi:hypothetical protein
MDYAMRVQILQCVDDLDGVALHLQLMQSLPPSQQFVHALIGAQFQQDIDVLSIFEEMFEFNYSLMMNRPMNFNLAHQLLLGPAFSQ